MHGIPVTSAARTLLDVTPELSDRALERAFDTGLKQGVFTRDAVARDAVARAAARAGPKPGVARVAALATAELGPIADARSRAAERFLEFVRASGLPPPEAEVPIGRYMVDFLWRAQRLAVEIDGFRFHATRRRLHHDRDRDLWLRGADLQVVHFSAEQVLEQPGRVLVSVARELAVTEARARERQSP